MWDIRILVASPTLIAVIPSQNRYLLAYCYPVWYTMPTANNRNACNKWKWAIPRNDKTIDAKPQSMAMQISSTKRMMFRHYMVVRRLGFFSFCLPASIYRTQPYITIAFTKFDHIILTIRSIGTNVCKSDCAKTNENDFQLWIEWNSKVAPVFFLVFGSLLTHFPFVIFCLFSSAFPLSLSTSAQPVLRTGCYS